MQWIYETPLDATVCISRLCDPQIGSVDELNPFDVEVTRLSDTQLYLVYKGRRFSKYRRTEYLVTLSCHVTLSPGTTITIQFKREFLNLQLPMTAVSELDAFMNETLNACRKA